MSSAPNNAAWTERGFRPDLELLSAVLALTDPKDVRIGSVAVGLDMWCAEMLRAAGLEHVQPHPLEPFYADPVAPQTSEAFSTLDRSLADIIEAERSLSNLLTGASLRTTSNERQALRTSVKGIRTAVQLVRRRIEQSTTTVLGEGRRKQVDVFIARWDRGLELLISTKTIGIGVDEDELVKNLSNRWEEFDGDLKNLRGRFPLAVIGALLVVPANATPDQLYAFADMMTKLTAPGRPWVNAYDQTAIAVVENWEAGTVNSVDLTFPAILSPSLSVDGFFSSLIGRLFERSPVSEHNRARQLRDAAAGIDSSIVEGAATIQAKADEVDDELGSDRRD